MPTIHVLTVPGADPERDRLVAQVKAGSFPVCVHADPDRNGLGWNWATMLLCAATHHDRSEWAVQLSDDALLLPGWEMELVGALRFSPSRLLGLAWSGTRRGAKAYAANVPYAVGPYLPHGLAIGYHRSILAELASWAARVTDPVHGLPPYQNDDVASALWCQRVSAKPFLPAVVGRSIFGTAPVRSLLGHSPYRNAAHTIADRGVLWSSTPSYVRDNHMAGRDDEEEVLRRGSIDR